MQQTNTHQSQAPVSAQAINPIVADQAVPAALPESAAPVAVAPVAVAPVAAQPDSMSLEDIFCLKAGDKVQDESTPVELTADVQSAVDHAEQLTAEYHVLKTQVLDRSDRSLWQILQKVYAFADSVQNSVNRDKTRAELIRKIRLRSDSNVSTASTLDSIVVRYIFSDQSRQTRSNYAKAMQKARAIGITTDKFAAFLEKYGGVAKVLEETFEYEKIVADSNSGTAKLRLANKEVRIKLTGQLYTGIAHTSATEINYTDRIFNWVPEKPKKSMKAVSKEEKTDPKYEQGRFVHFVAVRDSAAGKYHVVQGNIFDRAFEDQILGSLVDRMGAKTEDLEKAVAALQQQIGFEIK
jgi:hypothetical protein